MGLVEDTRQQQQRSGYVGPGLPDVLKKQIQKGRSGYPTGYISDPLQVVDPEVDYIWAHQHQDSRAPHTYFDYYFTGQDIQCYIDGVEKPEFGAAMPIMEFAFNISQQKTPVYGAWSYTYDAVMRGNRIINGAFRIATTYTGYMTDMIAKATDARVKKNTETILRGIDTDSENMEKYWGRTALSDSATMGGSYKHIFSTHPPFNFVLVYGIQSTSVTNNPTARREEIYSNYGSDTPLMTDVNERLVQADPNGSMRFVIENIELTNMQVEYTPDGAVCSEMYTFFARDMYMPRAKTQNLAGISTKLA